MMMSFLTHGLEYSMDLLHSFPVKALLTYAQTHPKEYGNVVPPLLSLVVSHLPQLFNVVSLLVEEEHLWRYCIRKSTLKPYYANRCQQHWRELLNQNARASTDRFYLL